MYERKYGAKYKELGGYQPASHIAKLMRADIKAAIGRGELPGKMANYSVRAHNFSMGRAIYIEARDLDGMWQQCPGYKIGTRTDYSDGGWSAVSCGYYEHEDPSFEGHQVLTEEGLRVEGILQAIHSAYNYDGSEVMVDYFDVNFYGSVSIATVEEDRRRAEQKRRKALQRSGV